MYIKYTQITSYFDVSSRHWRLVFVNDSKQNIYIAKTSLKRFRKFHFSGRYREFDTSRGTPPPPTQPCDGEGQKSGKKLDFERNLIASPFQRHNIVSYG